jgi:hypothetical protein
MLHSSPSFGWLKKRYSALNPMEGRALPGERGFNRNKERTTRSGALFKSLEGSADKDFDGGVSGLSEIFCTLLIEDRRRQHSALTVGRGSCATVARFSQLQPLVGVSPFGGSLKLWIPNPQFFAETVRRTWIPVFTEGICQYDSDTNNDIVSKEILQKTAMEF